MIHKITNIIQPAVSATGRANVAASDGYEAASSQRHSQVRHVSAPTRPTPSHPAPPSLSGTAIASRIARLVNRSNMFFDDMGSEGGIALRSFYVRPGQGHTRSKMGMVEVGHILHNRMPADRDREIIEQTDVDRARQAGAALPIERFVAANSFTAADREAEKTRMLLDRIVESNSDTPAKAEHIRAVVALMRSELHSIKAVVYGTDHMVLHPVAIVGTAADGSVVGLRSYVVWT